LREWIKKLNDIEIYYRKNIKYYKTKDTVRENVFCIWNLFGDVFDGMGFWSLWINDGQTSGTL